MALYACLGLLLKPPSNAGMGALLSPYTNYLSMTSLPNTINL